MKKFGFTLLVAIGLCGCAMFTSWKAIPPPGGCNQCHTLPINAKWTVAYAPVTLSDESGKYSWQTEASVLPEQESPMQQQKISEEPCFRCHREPNKAHTDRLGRYHH